MTKLVREELLKIKGGGRKHVLHVNGKPFCINKAIKKPIAAAKEAGFNVRDWTPGMLRKVDFTTLTDLMGEKEAAEVGLRDNLSVAKKHYLKPERTNDQILLLDRIGESDPEIDLKRIALLASRSKGKVFQQIYALAMESITGDAENVAILTHTSHTNHAKVGT